MKLLSVVGARPQFIKAAPFCPVLAAADHKEMLVYTAQHYDQNMSTIFFKDMEIADPKYNLGVGSGSHRRRPAAARESADCPPKHNHQILAVTCEVLKDSYRSFHFLDSHA